MKFRSHHQHTHRHLDAVRPDVIAILRENRVNFFSRIPHFSAYSLLKGGTRARDSLRSARGLRSITGCYTSDPLNERKFRYRRIPLHTLPVYDRSTP